MSEKTTYTTLWEQDYMQDLYKRFSVIVKPFEVPLLDIAIQRINETFKDKQELSIFEIGAGSGQHTKIILNGIAKDHSIIYTGIDVSLAQKNTFEGNIKNFPGTILIKEYSLSSWQEYSVTSKYDVVLAQHSWYGIGSAVEHFEKLKAALADDGVGFIMLNPEGNVSQIAMEDNGEHPFSSEGIEQGLLAAGLSYEKVTSYSDLYNKQDFCKDGTLTQFGKDHFSYLYRKDLQGNEENVIKMIQNAPDEAFRFPTDIFIVRK